MVTMITLLPSLPQFIVKKETHRLGGGKRKRNGMKKKEKENGERYRIRGICGTPFEDPVRVYIELPYREQEK